MGEIESIVIGLERDALIRWGKGDPDGFLEISSSDVIYFDPYQELRIDGLEALREYYETIRGKVFFDRFELLNAHVQTDGRLAVLTFNYISYTDEKPDRWNCTEVFRFERDSWRIIQTHWSYTNVFKYKVGKEG